jgi:hypothetical protein
MFGNLVHASPPNIPYPRKIVYRSALRRLQPHHPVHPARLDRAPRFAAIVPVDDDALAAYARARRVAAE